MTRPQAPRRERRSPSSPRREEYSDEEEAEEGKEKAYGSSLSNLSVHKSVRLLTCVNHLKRLIRVRAFKLRAQVAECLIIN